MLALPGIQRTLTLYRMDMRGEALKEWSWTVRNFNDQELLTAAEIALPQISSIITPIPEPNSARKRQARITHLGPSASGTSSSGAGKTTQPTANAGPTPILRAMRLVTSAPITPPTAPAPRPRRSSRTPGQPPGERSAMPRSRST